MKETDPMSEMLKVAETKDVPPGTAIAVEVSGQKVALFNADAFGRRCKRY